MASPNTIFPKYMLPIILLFIIISCSKDNDLFNETIAEEITKQEQINSDESEDNLTLIDDVYNIEARSVAFLLDVLKNDSIPQEQISEIEIVTNTFPKEGELEINNDNTLSYTPNINDSNENGEIVRDEFTYSVKFTDKGEEVQKEAVVTVNTQYSDNGAVNDMGELKAFPSAYGPGSVATGGRGKVLAIVNTLDPYASLSYFPKSGGNDEYYTGGFISALQEEKVGYIVFDVSGDLHMGIGKGWYSGFKNINNKTVFGQSAPEGGITLTERSLRFDGSNGDNKNLIFRYLRSRPIYNQNGAVSTEDDAFTWGFLFYGGEGIIVDHCSVSFAQDKAIGAYIDESHATNNIGLKNITFSHNFIQDSNTGGYVEINPNRNGDPEELVDAISWHNNIFSGVNRTPNLAFSGRAEKINNVIHNTPSKNTSVYHSLMLNVEGNYYQRQSTTPDKIRVNINDATSGDPSVFSALNVFNGQVGGNSIDLQGNSSEDNSLMWSTLDANIQAPSSYFTTSRHIHNFPNPVAVVSAHEAFNSLVINADIGAYKYMDDNGYVKTFRDSFDTSQLSIVENNTDYTTKNPSNWKLPSIPHNTRSNTYDTDKDGMADVWEIRRFGNLQQSYRDDFDGDGYTNIEEFMNQVDFD